MSSDSRRPSSDAISEIGAAPTLPGSDVTATDPGGSGRPAAQAGAVAPGSVLLGRYRIERWLGAGGMGAVYAAHDLRLDHPVALKMVPQVADCALHDRLRDEVRTLQGITHRNVARTYNLEEHEGAGFIVMELVDGETLAARIARGPLSPAETVAILGQLVEALDEAHRRGVVHRDVKPANVMLAADGRVVLMDFGLARVGDTGPVVGGGSVDRTTSMKGTPAYMAPEVIRGLRADARADLYALGLVAYEMLTGGRAYQASHMAEMLKRHLEDDVPDARAARRDVPPRLAALVRQLMAKEPAQRPASAAAVRDALAKIGDCKRRGRGRWLAAAVLGAALVAGALVAYVAPDGEELPTRDEAADAANKEEAKAAYMRAEEAYNLGQFDEAIAGYSKAYAAWNRPLFLFNLAQVHRMKGDARRAVFYYKRFLATAEATKTSVLPEVRTEVERHIRELTEELQRDEAAPRAPDIPPPPTPPGGPLPPPPPPAPNAPTR